MTRLAQLISNMEGFGLPGSMPTRKHNPGDLRHSPHSSHDGEGCNDVGIIDTDAHGWEDLERQLEIYASRGMTLRDCIGDYAPPDENDTGHYLAFACKGLGCGPDALMRDVLKIQAAS